MISNTCVHSCVQSTHRFTVDATDGVRPASNRTCTIDRDWETVSADETGIVRKLDPELTVELTERCGARLEHTPWSAQRAEV